MLAFLLSLLPLSFIDSYTYTGDLSPSRRSGMNKYIFIRYILEGLGCTGPLKNLEGKKTSRLHENFYKNLSPQALLALYLLKIENERRHLLKIENKWPRVVYC